jgi:hypothetical protein
MTSIEIRENGLLVKNKKIKFGNYAYISTTKATTGITIPNLKGIYQYGTAYNANTFIQLLGRLRSGGFVHYIQPKFEHQQEKFVKNHTIGLVKGFQELNVVKLSESFSTPEFQNWIRNNFYIPFHQKDLEGFLDHFKEALQVIEAKGLGHFTIERDDYIFTGAKVINIEELFDSSDTINFEKYIDRIIIDWLNQNGVELLNEIYNLSFVIKEVKYQKSVQKMELISSDDKEQKREKRKKLNSETKEFYNQLEQKFQGCLPLKTLKKSFSLGELTRLNEIDIDLEEIKNIKHQYDKIVLLKSKMIPIKKILQIAKKIIEKNGYCLIRDLDNELQKIYIINSRTKMVYFKFLIDIFQNSSFNSEIQYMERKQIGNKRVFNLLIMKK